jgi:hypothetical protein
MVANLTEESALDPNMDKDKVKASSMEVFEYKLAEDKVGNKQANRMKGIARHLGYK